MKKLLLILLALTMCVSMCACGSKTDEIKQELESKSWYYNTIIRWHLTFEDGFCTIDHYGLNDDFTKYSTTPFASYYGSYEVYEDGRIVVYVGLEKKSGDSDYKVSDKDSYTFYYTYENGILEFSVSEGSSDTFS